VTGRPHRAAASGFTLLELIVVLLIAYIPAISTTMLPDVYK